MPSKFDQLRGGQSVEIEPGVSGRLNAKDRTLQLSTGEVLNVADDPDFFPQGEKQLALSRQKELIEKGVKGKTGEFAHQYANQGLLGGARDWVGYLTQTGDEYVTRKQAENQVSQRISEESPYTSGAATAASFATDIAATRGMSALKAAPLLTIGSAGSRLATEPGEVAGEALLAGGLGFGLDKATGYLNRVAQRRGAIRSLPGEQQSVTNRNRLGQQAVAEFNALQTQEFNALKQNVKNVNEARLQQHQTDLNNRQNKMIEAQNAYEKAKSARDLEVVNLKNQAEIAKAQRSAESGRLESEYKAAKSAAEQESRRLNEEFKLAQTQYQQALKDLPEIQKKAQQEYSENVIKNAEGISNAFPKESKIYSSNLGTSEFVENSIQKSGVAGSREANQASRILKSIFPEGEILTGKELSGRYKSLEQAMQKSSPEVRQILNDFKTHMGGKLNTILSDNLAYTKIIPTLKRQVEREVTNALNEMGLSETGIMSRSFLKRRAETNLNHLFREITPQAFLEKFQNGQIRQEILKGVMNPNDFAVNLSNLKPGRKAMKLSSDELQRLGINVPDPSQQKYDEFINFFMPKLDKYLSKAEMKVLTTPIDASTKLGAKVRKTFGVAENVPNPSAPVPPTNVPFPSPPAELPPISPINLPPPVAPPQSLPMPAKPSLVAQPNQPPPNTFIPQPEPVLPPANGMAERTGDFLEKNLMGGNTLVNNPLTKLAGLKYLFGNAALPAEAGYLGMKGLTSPSMGGEVARMSFKQGGIQAIESWAQRYPSYHDGILDSPQDRRSLTKEIEDASEIPIEQKAVLQSKVNRGKPIQERL